MCQSCIIWESGLQQAKLATRVTKLHEICVKTRQDKTRRHWYEQKKIENQGGGKASWITWRIKRAWVLPFAADAGLCHLQTKGELVVFKSFCVKEGDGPSAPWNTLEYTFLKFYSFTSNVFDLGIIQQFPILIYFRNCRRLLVEWYNWSNGVKLAPSYWNFLHPAQM